MEPEVYWESTHFQGTNYNPAYILKPEINKSNSS
jgi:hypothetical protein